MTTVLVSAPATGTQKGEKNQARNEQEPAATTESAARETALRLTSRWFFAGMQGAQITARQKRRIRNGCCKQAFASGWKPAARRAGQRRRSWLCAKHDSRQDAHSENRNGQKTGNGRIRRCYRWFNRRLTIIRYHASREHQERKYFSFVYCTTLYPVSFPPRAY